MNGIAQLSELVVSGFTDWKQYGEVNANYYDDLVLFNYTPAAQYERRWNWFERVSRGLMLNVKTGDVVARPFDKFFNWGENGETSDGEIVKVTEKLDGSLGILYWHNGENKIATRGSFDGEQAIKATEMLHQKGCRLTEFHPDWTLLFEIIYPENRVVVDYGDREDLVLLAKRNKATGEYLPFRHICATAHNYGFDVPSTFQFDSVADILNAKERLDGWQEGWVVEFSDGQRFKFKGDRYLEIHRLLYHTSFKRVVEAVAAGSLDEAIKDIPDEFIGQIRDWQAQIEEKVAVVVKRATLAFDGAPKGTRKEFALWVQENYPELSTYLFMMLDGHDIMSTIYKREF